MAEEVKTLTTILRHRVLVQQYVYKLMHDLQTRAIEHDLSKLRPDEFNGFVSINKIAREHTYGSEEYKKSLKDQKDVIELHYRRNSHHPEHYQNGVKEMNFLDIIEMVCDWKAAAETYGQTSLAESLRIQIERFDLTAEMVYLIKLIIEAID